MMRNYNDDVVIVCVVEDRCATLSVNSVYSWRTPDNTQPALSTQSSELSSANWIGSFVFADAVSPPPVPPTNTISFGANSAACWTLPANRTECRPPKLKHWHAECPRTSSITNGYTYLETNWSSQTVPSATQHRPFGMDFLLQSVLPVHWNISNGRWELARSIVRLTVTDTWHPALKILPIVNDY